MSKLGNVTGWITVRGKHIPIIEGESKQSAVDRYKRYQKAKSMPTRNKKMILEDAAAKKNSIRRERKNIKVNKDDKFRNEDRKKNIIENKLSMQDLRSEYNRATYRDMLKSGNKISGAKGNNSSIIAVKKKVGNINTTTQYEQIKSGKNKGKYREILRVINNNPKEISKSQANILTLSQIKSDKSAKINKVKDYSAHTYKNKKSGKRKKNND